MFVLTARASAGRVRHCDVKVELVLVVVIVSEILEFLGGRHA